MDRVRSFLVFFYWVKQMFLDRVRIGIPIVSIVLFLY